MPLITDPTDLSQGASTAVTDLTVGTVTARAASLDGTSLPVIDAGEIFELRDHSDAENNGLWEETGGSPSTSSITATKLTGVDPVANASGEAVTFYGTNADEKSVHVDTNSRDVYLIEQGNLDSAGVTHQALYSFLKEEWKGDPDLIAFPFPIVAVTPEQFEWQEGWNPEDDATDAPDPDLRTRKLIRTGGWSEIDANSVLQAQYSGIISLGTFEDTVSDNAYYQLGNDPTDTAAAVDFDFAGPVNEAVQVYNNITPLDGATGFDFVDGGGGNDQISRNDAGSWVTEGYVIGGQVEVANATVGANDGTYTILAVTASDIDVATASLTAATGDNTATFAVDNRNAVGIFLRVRDSDAEGKTYAQAGLSDIGVTAVDNKVFRFPVANATDLKITATDGDMASSPYSEIQIRYWDEVYHRDVDSATDRNFGIGVDVGTYSMPNGVSNTTTTFTSAASTGITLGDYTGGSLIIHEGTDQGTHTITGTPTEPAGTLTVVLTAALTGSETNLSFTLQRATPVVATAEEIYEKVQYSLRQASDVDSSAGVVTGRTADELLTFVGDSLKAGASLPTNPNGGGSGVIIEGFDSNDTNRLSFFDNGAVERTYPFVAAGTINFNSNLVSDTGPAEYWMYFEYTERFTNTGFGLSSPTGPVATLDSSVTNLVTELPDGDEYIYLNGFTDTTLNGVYQLTGAAAGSGPWTAPVVRIDNTTITAEAAAATVSLDKNPIDSPDAILVDNDAGADITGNVPGASTSFDFDYDGNVQGGRTAATDAAIVLRAIGLDLAQFVQTTGTITRATGLVFTLVAALERNYDNP